MDFIKEGGADIRVLFRRIKNRDFSGYGGMALKNSIYQFSTSLVARVGALIFTIILARLLMPELFGLYSLALSTILIFVSFSDLGMGDTMVRFVSRELGKRNTVMAMAYSKYFIKIKILVMFLVSFILILSAKFIAGSYYHKPIYLALIAGSLYIFFGGIIVILTSILQAYNLFKPIFYREIIFQIIRIVLIPLVVLFAIKNTLNKETIVFLIIITLSLSFVLLSIFLYIFTKKVILKKDASGKNLSKSDKKKFNRFVAINSTVILSGVFFGFIDVVMLGYFVSSEYIGYYQGAFSFIGAMISLITFSAVLLPIFSRLNKGRMDKFMQKTTKTISLISLASFLFLFFASKPLVLVILGKDYLHSINILRILSLMLLSVPVTTVYSTYFVSSGKPEVVSKSLISSTILNIALTYILITSLIGYSPLYAVYGAAVAAVISRYVYIMMLVFYKKKDAKMTLKKV